MSYLFFLDQRARSSSRRRGRDKAESLERTATGPFYQSFSSPTLGPNQASSTHSSPASVNLPSPTPGLANTSEVVQTESKSLSTSALKNPGNYQYTAPVSPAQLQSPQRFEFDYGVQPSPLSQSSTQQQLGNKIWVHGSNGDQQIFATGVSDPPLYSFNAYNSPLDLYQSYEPTTDLSGGLGGLTSSPTSTSYPTSLPFRGLDFIRNYNPSGYGGGEQDSLWQSYDPGAFGCDPDLLITLGDPTNELHDTVPQS